MIIWSGVGPCHTPVYVYGVRELGRAQCVRVAGARVLREWSTSLSECQPLETNIEDYVA